MTLIRTNSKALSTKLCKLNRYKRSFEFKKKNFDVLDHDEGVQENIKILFKFFIFLFFYSF